MTLEQLRIYVAVAERQHVTRTAQALNLVQSAASAAIAALEARHGTRLFHRVGRRSRFYSAEMSTPPNMELMSESRATTQAKAKSRIFEGRGWWNL
jgi:hypothetical protein